jgi:anti-sigma-K factor RskA
VGEQPLHDPPEVTAPVVSLDEHRRSRGWWLVGAAAAIIVAMVGVTIWVRQADDATVLASTELEPLGAAGQGSAEVVDRNGSLQLRLVTDGVEATDGFTEVWLINPDVTELISLGPIRSDGTYDLPAGLDPQAFPIVDVSFESFDGNPQHSGNSVLRGELSF